jgi:hypothetical protein
MSFSIVSSDIFNTLNASAGFDDFFIASGAAGMGVISYTFTPTSTSNVGIIVNGAAARLKLSQSGSSLIDTQACSYTVVSFPIFAFPCIAPVTGSAQIVFGTPFEVAASFAVNASGLDFGPLAATAKLTYSITAADGTPLPLASLQVAAVPEPSSLLFMVMGVSLLVVSRRILSAGRQ